MLTEIANLAGLSHTGAPVITRWSTNMPTKAAKQVMTMATPRVVNARLAANARCSKCRNRSALRALVCAVIADDFIVFLLLFLVIGRSEQAPSPVPGTWRRRSERLGRTGTRLAPASA